MAKRKLSSRDLCVMDLTKREIVAECKKRYGRPEFGVAQYGRVVDLLVDQDVEFFATRTLDQAVVEVAQCMEIA